MPIALATCWSSATHFELDGVACSPSLADVRHLHAHPANPHLPATLFQLTDTNLRVALFADQPVDLDHNGCAVLQEFPPTARRQARVRFLVAAPLRPTTHPLGYPGALVDSMRRDDPESRLPAFT